MIDDMPRPRPLYLLRETTRHDKVVWYFRKGGGPRIRLRGEYGSAEFTRQYNAALAGLPLEPEESDKALSGSLRWLWERYMESTDWAELAPATRRQRENIMLHVLEKSGARPFKKIEQFDIEQAKDARRETPSQARNFLDCVRGLFRWAKRNAHVRTDPTEGVVNPKKRKGRGFPIWTEEDLQRYEKRWPLGTKERVWIETLLNSGGRRGDCWTLGKQHRKTVIDPETGRPTPVITWHTEKSGKMVEVTIPVLPPLQAALDAGPCGDLAFIVKNNGQPFKSKESFGNSFSRAARDAGVEKSAHGVRKIAATRAADNGATAYQLMAMFGWISLATAEIYTRETNRRRLGLSAGHMLLLGTPAEQPIPAPKRKVRGPARIVQENQ